MFYLYTHIVAPVCRHGQKVVYSTGRHETIKVLCDLEANPFDVTFNWKFNSSAKEFLDIPMSYIAVDRTKSTAHYTPMTERVCAIFFINNFFNHFVNNISILF